MVVYIPKQNPTEPPLTEKGLRGFTIWDANYWYARRMWFEKHSSRTVLLSSVVKQALVCWHNRALRKMSWYIYMLRHSVMQEYKMVSYLLQYHGLCCLSFDFAHIVIPISWNACTKSNFLISHIIVCCHNSTLQIMRAQLWNVRHCAIWNWKWPTLCCHPLVHCSTTHTQQHSSKPHAQYHVIEINQNKLI